MTHYENLNNIRKMYFLKNFCLINTQKMNSIIIDMCLYFFQLFHQLKFLIRGFLIPFHCI